MKLEVSKKPIAAFSFSSLTDIVLLLLIFFLLTSQFVINNGVQVKLPKASNADKENLARMVVSINQKEEIFFMGKKTSLSALPSDIEKKQKKKNENKLIVEADKRVSLDVVIKVIDIAIGLGIDKFTIQTEKE
jgi:biopolymer transport protein ExbD